MLTKVLVGSVITVDRFREAFLKFLHLGQSYHEQKSDRAHNLQDIYIRKVPRLVSAVFALFAKFQSKLTPGQTMP